MKRTTRLPLAIGALALASAIATWAAADEVTVVAAHADCQQRVCRFDVTLRHADSGWEHYADRWQVLTPDGEVLGTRVLLHPHVDEQPFTRSLGGVAIPAGLDRVVIRARDSRHGESDNSVTVTLP